MEKLVNSIKKGKVLLSDGAWGTFLQAKGLQPGECPELWNLTRPDDVLEIARSYIDAGSDMIETNSFGGNYFKLQAYGLQDKVIAINQAAAKISREAAGSDKHVLGSIGPTGKMLIMGDVTENELFDAFRNQAISLEEGGADAIVVETMSDTSEATLAVSAAKQNTRAEIICTMTFEKTVDNQYKSMMGIAPADMVKSVIDAGADIIGANCGNGMEGMIQIVEEIRKIDATIPVLIHANAGMPVYKDGETVFPETPEAMSSLVKQLIRAGANVIGGCCGTTPEHIRQMARVIHEV